MLIDMIFQGMSMSLFQGKQSRMSSWRFESPRSRRYGTEARLQKSAAGFLDVEGALNPKVFQEYPKGQYGWGMALNGLWCSDWMVDAERNLNLRSQIIFAMPIHEFRRRKCPTVLSTMWQSSVRASPAAQLRYYSPATAPA
jgi:hypothetical protein